MPRMKLLAAIAIIAALGVGRMLGATAEETWSGKISDSMCKADHKDNGGTMQKDHDCTEKCVKGGSKYVFVNTADKKVYNISNQTFAGLSTHAGHSVQLTGEMKGDTITVSKIVMPPAK